MAATFRTRPRLPIFQSGARCPAPSWTLATRQNALAALTQDTSRSYASKAPSRMNRYMPQPKAGGFRRREQRGDSDGQPRSQMGNLTSKQLPLMMPQTFVAQPLSRCPRSPSDFFAYQWARFKQRLMNIGVTFALKFASKPRFFRRAAWTFKRSDIVPTAKKLHATMNTALASGDKHLLRTVVNDRTADRLFAAIDARPRGKSYEWSLLKYTSQPTIADHKALTVPVPGPSSKNVIVNQAVVRIPSRQRLVEVDAFARGSRVGGGGSTGAKGPEKIKDVLEYIVIQQVVDPTTYKAQEFVVWGTTQETTLESWRGLLSTVAQEEAKTAAKERQKWSA